jgi:hypothetical protein
VKTLLKWGLGNPKGRIFAPGWPRKAVEQFTHGNVAFFDFSPGNPELKLLFALQN